MKNLSVLVLSCLAISVQGCVGIHHSLGKTDLLTVSIIDRNGMSETINNPERIKQYRGVNFLHPQPYEKVLCIHKRTQEGNIPSFLHSYHENGQVKQYLEILNSRAQGNYTEWHSNGKIKLKAFIIGGEADLSQGAERSWIFDGLAYAWDEEGNLQAKIRYEKGLLCGDSIYYHSNGSVWKVVPFFEGGIHGLCRVYLNDGGLFQTAEYEGGKLHGSLFRYWPCGQEAIEERYVNNMLNFGRYKDQNGKLISEINDGNGYKAIFGKTNLAELHEFRNGLPEGEIKIFGADNKLHLQQHVKNGLMHGEEIEYYEAPPLRHIPKLLVSWYEGKIQGISKTWYDNGVQESNREMSNNAKNGISIAWYREGSLMLIEEYQQDKLIKGEYYRKGAKSPISVVKNGVGTATLFDSEGNFLEKIYYENSVPIGAA